MVKDTATSGPRLTIWHKVAVAVMVLFLVGLGVGAHTWKDSLHVREIAVEGNDLVAETALRQSCGIIMGAPLFTVNLNRVRAKLLENPCIKEASVERDAPGRIVLSVVERVPVAAAVGSRLHYLDQEGYVMPAIPSGKVVDVPVLSGSMLSDQLKPGKRVTSCLERTCSC
jgi:cell division protein FtsQ